MTGTIIHVDRKEKVQLGGKLVFPELHSCGPESYRFSDLQIWCHDGQKNGSMMAREVCSYLKKRDMIKECLNLHDAMSIRNCLNNGEIFPSQLSVFFFWKSVVKIGDGSFSVPYLAHRGSWVLNWGWMGEYVDSGDLTLLLPKK